MRGDPAASTSSDLRKPADIGEFPEVKDDYARMYLGGMRAW